MIVINEVVGCSNMSRSVLVTGGAGFIGSHLSDSLLREGWTVTVLDNFDEYYSSSEKRLNIEQALRHPQYTLIEGDIRDEAVLARLRGNYEVVVHLAARAGVRPSIEQPKLYESVNVGGTQALLEACRTWRTQKFVLASSSSVYGVSPHVPWSETEHVLRPISPYAATKVACELLAHTYSHLFGLQVVVLRFFTVYGPRQRPDLAIRKFAEYMLRGRSIPVFGDGSTRRDYTYVHDIVNGIKKSFDYSETSYEVFNLGNDRTVTLNELIATLEVAFGVRAHRTQLPQQPGDVPQTWADIEKARSLLGWSPQTDLSNGLAAFSEWLRHEAVASEV